MQYWAMSISFGAWGEQQRKGFCVANWPSLFSRRCLVSIDLSSAS